MEIARSHDSMNPQPATDDRAAHNVHAQRIDKKALAIAPRRDGFALSEGIPSGIGAALGILVDRPERDTLARAVQEIRHHYGADACLLVEQRKPGDLTPLTSSGENIPADMSVAVETFLQGRTPHPAGGSPVVEMLYLDPYARQLCAALFHGECNPLVTLLSFEEPCPIAGRAMPLEALLKALDAVRHRGGLPVGQTLIGEDLCAQSLGARSFSMRQLHRYIRAAKDGIGPVLLVGGPGTGKTHVAPRLHGGGAFVVVDCSAEISKPLLAARRREAAGGTLFLKRVTQLPLDLQVELLDTRGGAARIVASANLDVAGAVRRGHFQEEVYTYLSETVLRVPLLCDRQEDFLDLVELFLQRASRRTGKALEGVTVGAMDALMSRPWPGNVRELEQVIHHLVDVLPHGGVITEDQVAAAGFGWDGISLDRLQASSKALGDAGKEAILSALQHTRGDVSRAASLLGISRGRLVQRLKRRGISRQPLS